MDVGKTSFNSYSSSMTVEDTISNNASSDDEILKMFFDESYVPQAFVDILLTNATAKGINQVQTVSSSLLSRLDYYTKHLTKELETTIRNLENLSETLPGTWTVNASVEGEDEGPLTLTGLQGSSKLEYYLDTLASAVRALETDMEKIDGQMSELNLKYESSTDVVEKLFKLETVKERLHKVLKHFKNMKTILAISAGSTAKQSSEDALNISITEFKVSLKILEETINHSLVESSSKEVSSEINEELLNKIDLFTELRPLFKGLDKFYPPYSDFVEKIKREAQYYLSTKDIGGDLNI